MLVHGQYLNITKVFYYIQAYEPEFYDNKDVISFIKRFIAASTYYLPMIRVVNADIYRDYKNLHSKYVIPPGLDLEIYHSQINQWDGIRKIKIGCIGRNEEWKGAQDVAAAIDILSNDGIEVEFIVAFNPVKCVSEYKLVKPDGDDNLADYYRNLDILIAPAKLQLGAIHYPVIEAMACGTCVITTGYYPADDSNSYIVPVSSPESIAATIKNIMNNYDEALKKVLNAQDEIQRFDWKNVSNDFLKIFKENI